MSSESGALIFGPINRAHFGIESWYEAYTPCLHIRIIIARDFYNGYVRQPYQRATRSLVSRLKLISSLKPFLAVYKTPQDVSIDRYYS